MYSIFLQSILVYNVHVLTLFSQIVGVTSALPESVPYSLHPYREYQASSKEWLYRDNQLLHNETATDFPHLPSLDDDPPVGFRVGLLIDNTGALHIFFNGTSSEKLVAGLPINKRLWGIVDVRGNCNKIKSEMLSGKLDGVNVCVF